MPKPITSQLQSSESASVQTLGSVEQQQQVADKLKAAVIIADDDQIVSSKPDQTKQQVPSSYGSGLATAAYDKELDGRVDSFDHVTFWVGNARQSAVFYMTQFGFEPLAFRGLETGSRDLACHVLRLNDTIIQLVSAVEPNNRELNDFLMSHGDAVKDVAFRVEQIESLLEHALENGAELVKPLEVLTFDDERERGESSAAAGGCLDRLVMKRATIRTFGDVTHTFIERNYEYQQARFLPGYHKPSLEVSSGCDDLTSRDLPLMTHHDDATTNARDELVGKFQLVPLVVVVVIVVVVVESFQVLVVVYKHHKRQSRCAQAAPKAATLFVQLMLMFARCAI